MARCKSCGFNLSLHDERSGTPGRCDGCGERVCFVCGCTDSRPCITPNLPPCSWQQLSIAEEEPGRIGLGVSETPGLCNRCYQFMAAQLYAQATSQVLVVEQAG